MNLKQAIFEMAWLPKPFLTNTEWSVADALVNDPELQRNLPEQAIPIYMIETTQARLNQDTVDKYADRGLVDGGLVFKRFGHYYLYDGHHRHFAAVKSGSTERTCKVLELPDPEDLKLEGEEGMDIQGFASLLKVRPQSILNAMSTDDRRIHESK